MACQEFNRIENELIKVKNPPANEFPLLTRSYPKGYTKLCFLETRVPPHQPSEGDCVKLSTLKMVP